jgi:hypothetical protein
MGNLSSNGCLRVGSPSESRLYEGDARPPQLWRSMTKDFKPRPLPAGANDLNHVGTTEEHVIKSHWHFVNVKLLSFQI